MTRFEGEKICDKEAYKVIIVISEHGKRWGGSREISFIKYFNSFNKKLFVFLFNN